MDILHIDKMHVYTLFSVWTCYRRIDFVINKDILKLLFFYLFTIHTENICLEVSHNIVTSDFKPFCSRTTVYQSFENVSVL
jgi:hypothetical protein